MAFIVLQDNLLYQNVLMSQICFLAHSSQWTYKSPSSSCALPLQSPIHLTALLSTHRNPFSPTHPPPKMLTGAHPLNMPSRPSPLRRQYSPSPPVSPESPIPPLHQIPLPPPPPPPRASSSHALNHSAPSPPSPHHPAIPEPHHSTTTVFTRPSSSSTDTVRRAGMLRSSNTTAPSTRCTSIVSVLTTWLRKPLSDIAGSPEDPLLVGANDRGTGVGRSERWRCVATAIGCALLTGFVGLFVFGLVISHRDSEGGREVNG